MTKRENRRQERTGDRKGKRCEECGRRINSGDLCQRCERELMMAD